MLTQANRLKKSKDIERVLKNGKRFSEGFLVIKTLPNGLDKTRFAFIASQKFSKKAVERNKIRRQLRETTRQNLERIKKGMDVIVWAVLADEGRAVKEARVVMERVLSKANLITNIDKQAK